jgi:hypothetical protein
MTGVLSQKNFSVLAALCAEKIFLCHPVLYLFATREKTFGAGGEKMKGSLKTVLILNEGVAALASRF